MKRKEPKPMQLITPAGSVYYYKIQNGANVREVLDFMEAQQIYSISDARAKEGFGLFHVGIFYPEKIKLNV